MVPLPAGVAVSCAVLLRSALWPASASLVK